MGQLMAALVKYDDSDSTKDPESDNEKAGKGKKSSNAKGPQPSQANQGGNNKHKVFGSSEFVAHTNAQGNNQRRKGRPPPRSGGQVLLSSSC